MVARCILAGMLIGATMRTGAETGKPPVRIAVAGLTHDHARGFFPRLRGRQDVELEGIVESDPGLIDYYTSQFGLDRKLFYPSLDALFGKVKVDAVAAFGSTYDHVAVVERCAKAGVDVMMEKPLAVNMAAAREIEAAAKRGKIEVFVNYETTWYPGTRAVYEMVHDRKEAGEIRRIVVHDGHQGPKELNCSKYFLAWLTDPVLNGGGALNDFGCYGADLATWLMDGEKPESVFAMTQQIKPDVYPKVEDEATIVMTYPKAQAIIQASWNWPFNRKDMEVYGRTGYVLLPQQDEMRVRLAGDAQEKEVAPAALTGPYADPVSYLVAVVRKEIVPEGLSSLAVNMTVVEILDAAHESARTGKRVVLGK